LGAFQTPAGWQAHRIEVGISANANYEFDKVTKTLTACGVWCNNGLEFVDYTGSPDGRKLHSTILQVKIHLNPKKRNFKVME